MSNLYKGPSIDASYQVSVHLAEGFQRRRLKCEKLTDDGRQVILSAVRFEVIFQVLLGQIAGKFLVYRQKSVRVLSRVKFD
jgi:hypothetical protein